MILRTSYLERRLAPGFAILRRVKPLFLIDTDTASDDAVALIMALRSPEVNVLAITTVVGNVSVAQASKNALYVAVLCGSMAPVYAGSAASLRRPVVLAGWAHGLGGWGDQDC